MKTRRSKARYKEIGSSIVELCSLLREDDTSRLKLRSTNRRLFQEGAELRMSLVGKPLISLTSPSVSLASLISASSLRGQMQRRLVLSYLLAKAVWQFYDADWMNEDWTRDTINFMRQMSANEASLSHKPFILSELQPVTSRPALEKRTHLLPRVLALGVVLLEIEIGRTVIPVERGDNSKKDDHCWANKVHSIAAEFISTEEWRIRRSNQTPEPLADAIEICLKPDLEILDLSSPRSSLYTTIVDRLGKLIRAMWPSAGSQPEAIDPGAIHFHESSDQSRNHSEILNSQVSNEDERGLLGYSLPRVGKSSQLCCEPPQHVAHTEPGSSNNSKSDFDER